MVKSSHFERFARHYDFLTKILMMGTYHRVRRRIIAGRSVEKALDLCCGTGYVTGHINARQVVAFDLSGAMLGVNKEKNKALDSVSPVVGDAFSLPFPEDTFDAVYHTLAAHEFKDISSILKEAYRVLRAGGELILYDFAYPENRILQYTYLPFLKHIVELGTFFVYNTLEWEMLLRKTGFKEIDSESLYRASILVRARK